VNDDKREGGMDYQAFGPYFVALVAYAVSPGPLMAVLVARSLGNDWRGATVFAAGLCLGEVIAVIAVILGIGIWAQSEPELLALVKYAGVVYLVWLAVKMWNDRAGVASAQLRKVGWLTSACAGIALCLSNPATMLMQMLLLPIVAPNGIASAEHTGVVVLATFAAFGIVFFGTIPLARQFSRIIASPASVSLLNRVTAGVIALTSVWILAI
jgi:threonine/homoserine/homoserine lactone efflux protein